MKTMINENPQKYYYGQTNPLKSENPCPLPTSNKHLGKSRGLMAFDLMKTCKKSRFPVEITQGEIQECSRPSFDHPKILHILIDRAAGVGCKSLAKGHGGSPSSISAFVQSMGFSVINCKDKIKREVKRDSMKEAINLMYAELLNERRQITKYDERRHWKNHNSYFAWLASKNYYIRNPDRPVYLTDDEKKQRVREQRSKPINRIRHNIRKRLRDYMKASGSRWGGFGCTSDELRSHLESQFKRGMTWDNYGTHWHVDHIRPLATFDLFDKAQRDMANHYTNLQPLKAEHNLAKSDNWDGQIGFDHILG